LVLRKTRVPAKQLKSHINEFNGHKSQVQPVDVKVAARRTPNKLGSRGARAKLVPFVYFFWYFFSFSSLLFRQDPPKNRAEFRPGSTCSWSCSFRPNGDWWKVKVGRRPKIRWTDSWTYSDYLWVWGGRICKPKLVQP